MSTTITMTVREARKRLADTSRLSPEQVNELEQIVARFYGSRPPRGKQCVACSAAVWEERSSKDGNDSVWCCGGCGRSASLSADEWMAQRQAAEAVRQVQDAAAVPEPHETLKDALAARAEANAAVVKLDRAAPVARMAVVEAQVRHDRAVATAEAANANSAENLAATFYTGTKPPDSARTAAAARGELAAATDALVVAKNAKTILDTKVADARSALGFAEAAARRAALRVLTAEHLEDLIEAASIARAAYIDAVAALSWLIRNHAVPDGDVRPNQLVREADTPPSTWREAQHADGGMTARLAALTEGASQIRSHAP